VQVQPAVCLLKHLPGNNHRQVLVGGKDIDQEGGRNGGQNQVAGSAHQSGHTGNQGMQHAALVHNPPKGQGNNAQGHSRIHAGHAAPRQQVIYPIPAGIDNKTI